MRALLAQSRAEISMTIRRGETLLLTIGIPVILLVFFSEVKVTSTPTTSRIDFLAPGIIALCVMSTSMVALSISTAFERGFGVLRRLHVTPLGTTRLILAKTIGVLVVEAIQVSVISLVAAFLGWNPSGGTTAFVVAVALLALATVGFAGIGLALAGRLRPEVDLAAANGLYLVLLLISGFVIPVSKFPTAFQKVIVATPSGALADALHRVLGSGQTPGTANLVSLALWALVAPLIAARTFRFD